MKGNIRKRGQSQGWLLTIYTGRKLDGKPIRHYETVRGSKADAQRRLRELLTDMDKGTYAPPTKHTVEQLLKEWLEGYVGTNCSQRTYYGYESIIRRYLVPALGQSMLKDLQPPAIQTFYAEACQKVSNRAPHQKLSTRSVLRMHRVLSEALKWAVRQNYIGRNPAEFVDPPKANCRAMHTLSAFEVGILLDAAQDNNYYPIIYTAISTGLRRNELLALRWRDIDLDLLCLSVSRTLYKGNGKVEFKEPKTKYSRRRVSMTPKLALFLRDYKRQRENLYLELGSVLGPDDLVFANADGGPIDPSVVSHNYCRIVRKAGLDVRFHDLRHSYATLMLSAGVHPKIVSEALGHSTVAITLDTYSHVLPGLQEAAAKQLDSVLPEGIRASRERHGG